MPGKVLRINKHVGDAVAAGDEVLVLEAMKMGNPIMAPCDGKITGMPVSAYNSCGVSVQQAEHFVYLLASQAQSRYLHLAGAAPTQHPAGLAAGMNDAGQILTALVCAFLFAKAQL